MGVRGVGSMGGGMRWGGPGRERGQHQAREARAWSAALGGVPSGNALLLCSLLWGVGKGLHSVEAAALCQPSPPVEALRVVVLQQLKDGQQGLGVQVARAQACAHGRARGRAGQLGQGSGKQASALARRLLDVMRRVSAARPAGLCLTPSLCWKQATLLSIPHLRMFLCMA